MSYEVVDTCVYRTNRYNVAYYIYIYIFRQIGTMCPPNRYNVCGAK
jgi:hypothetical protein